MLLKDRLKEYEVLLASKSPRRRQLLADCGIEFRVAEGRDAEECYPADMPLEEVAEYLSQLKSDAYADVLEGGQVLITADTVVIAGGEILGKPKDREDALRMLSLLSGAGEGGLAEYGRGCRDDGYCLGRERGYELCGWRGEL